ncbi:RecQ family ATP-dependent DNA helicase [Ferruginibacter lapsinanis]|uniref:RecQ family ATP-dependent DNA helicase n=1 Tax=Ferruginibacter lapsinanis TaxID=563172 RepID=UPI001E4B85EA|nr:ATP-dependent DNA helicase RecQ [Ferruginibacter lapsinanis]UEG51102.1 RecQ family ATP-dependent DNA helicase [Ferruginibacter lapsinanis]
MTTKEILQEYWGYDSFRPLQEDIINAVLDGKDVLALLPTGGGKSICFQVPALVKDGICLVISPLIALMKDQVQNLKNRGILALSIYSGMSFPEVKKTLQNAAYGNYKFLYVSPERLETNLFLEMLPSMNISMIAVDEAHCISQWGYDFRPPYMRIASLREYLPDVPVLALTASATKNVQDDICEKLLFQQTHKRFQQSFERANLSYSVFNIASKQNKLLEILNNVKGSAIVYCKSRKQTKDIADLLLLNKINADYYHAGLSNEERNNRQEKWINNTTRVIACTNAFGMGIDKPDVRVVVHYGVPDCLENYYQEAGRAGRDGKRAYAVLLYNDRELADLEQLSTIRYPSKEEIKHVYVSLMNSLQIAAGGGEGMSLDFDIATFSAAFKINILTATYAIKALEQEDILSFNEVFFKPSTIVFNCNKDELNDFEKQHPQLENMIKGLLRSYEGIFDYPATIYEKQLAKFLQKKLSDVEKELKELKRFGIIDYSPQKDTPQITLLQNRMYNDSFTINLQEQKERKLHFEKRVKAMVDYINNKINCRSIEIADYFNDHTVKKCGICDNCINQHDLVISKEEFDNIARQIKEVVSSQGVSLKEILTHLPGIKKEKIWKVIDYLQSENELMVSKEGKIS